MGAVFSPCGSYRVRLDREISMLGGPTIGFCLHNPSTAGVEVEDPTSRRGINFAAAWGGSRLIYVNPWAGRATKPSDLWTMDDPVGPDNDRHIAEAASEIAASGGFMVVAWGAISPPASLRSAAHARLACVEGIIRAAGCEIRAIGVNKDGSPKHPLYVRGDALPFEWPRPLLPTAPALSFSGVGGLAVFRLPGWRVGFLAAIQLVLDRLPNERRHPVFADESHDPVPRVLSKAHLRLFHVQRWSPHATGINRGRKVRQSGLISGDAY